MRRLPLLLAAVLATALLAAPAPAATPTDDRLAPAPSPILTELGGRPVVQLNDGGGGLPYLGSATAYNAGDWENTLRTFHDSGTYDAEVNQIVNVAERYALRAAKKVRKAKKAKRRRPAVVLDIDETTLSNYSAIDADNFTFGTNSVNEAVNQVGKAIAPTLKLFNDAKAAKITVFFITGRGEAVRAPTEQNLQREGFSGWKTLYLKPAGSSLSTVQYKTGARKDIESQGYRIVANVGDQFSDLAGGHAMRGFKVPNPFYFLP
jgi:hypothetical protein